MNIGEALTYGLLGGTAGAAEHYYEDWRDRTHRAREQAYRKEGWQHQAEQAQIERDFRSAESEKERKFRSGEREAGQLYQSGEAEKERGFRSSQAWEARNFQAGQADADVQRQLRLTQGKADIAAQQGQQYTLNEQGKLVPVTPGAEGFAPPVAQMVGGKLEYLGVGKGGKGLLKGGTGSKSTGSSGPKSVKSGTGMTLAEGSVERDADGKLWQYVKNPQTNQFERIPVISRENAPVISTPEQVSEAEAFAETTVNDMASWFSSDASNFAPWGGSREAAKEYFKRNYLNNTLFDDQGNLIIPGQTQVPAPAATEPPQTSETAATQTAQQEESAKLFSSYSPEKQQQVRQFLSALDQNRDPDLLIQRMIELGFTEQELATLFPSFSNNQ